MNDKEKKILESLSKHLGVENIAPKVTMSDEEKQLKEQRFLDRFSKILGEKKEPEVLEEKTFVDAALANAKTETQPIFTPVETQPKLPEKDFVTKSVEALSKTTKKIDASAEPSDPVAKEIAVLKKSVLDLHHFASRISQMGGGGEVNLRYLDDVARNTIADGLYLRYDAATKKFIFDNSALLTQTAFISTYYSGANVACTNTAAVYIVPNGISADGRNNISIGSNNDFVIEKEGHYVINYSIQYYNTGNDSADVYVWLRKNGQDLADSSSIFTVHAKNNANIPGKLIAVSPLYFEGAIGDSIQVATTVPASSNVSIITTPAITANSTIANIPRTPATIFTVTQVA